MMNPLYILDRDHFASGVHAKFKCTDCHSADYTTYPHNGELKLEPLSTCLDCHGGDAKYAVYQFEKIDTEFQKSVHFQKMGETFTCSKCHNQHYYQDKSRKSSVVADIVGFSNEMCMSCHNNNSKFTLVSDKIKPALSQIHEWLPNQELHFKSVRCIECHTQVVDSLAVSHNILPKEKALKNCVECHSKNSMLEASLYKYKNLQSRSEKGKLNSIISNKSYVIGAYQNIWVNYISIAIILLTLVGICIHLIARIIKK
ncbi:MAG TPA: cytochrome c3 family protein [Prolixibacteraceae bacterium]